MECLDPTAAPSGFGRFAPTKPEFSVGAQGTAPEQQMKQTLLEPATLRLPCPNFQTLIQI
jgi:hypothetical protein